MSVIRRKFSIRHKFEIDDLQKELRDIAEDYLSAAMQSPFGIAGLPKKVSVADRLEWIDANILNPARTIFEAFSKEQSHQLSEWGDPIKSPSPNRRILLEQLQTLISNTEEVRAGLADRFKNTNQLTELKIDFAMSLTGVFQRLAPNAPIGVGTKKRNSSKSDSKYVDFISLCSREIFGPRFKISSRILSQVKKMI
jgi:hypothetical protein